VKIFCCSDYREFVETLVLLEKERENIKNNLKIRIKSDEKLSKVKKEPVQTR
jgi:hypothetical protein